MIDKKYFLLLFTLFSFVNLFGQNKSFKITFILNSSPLPEDSSVFITGGIDQLGNWDPAKIKMNYIGNDRWIKEINLSEPSSFEYKYTLGLWEREGVGADGLPLSNYNVDVKSDTVLNDEIFFWKNKIYDDIRSSITGRVIYHSGMKGKNILPRDVVVWLPPGYENDPNNKYPVLYMHDGQNIFDISTSAFGVEWNVDETMDSLIRNRVIPPIIVVGICNTIDRRSEYTPGDTGAAYIDFVVSELKPFIDSVYRTKPGRENTFTGGSSAGGLISFIIAWENSEVFSKAICMSPALKISYIDYVTVVDSSEAPENLFYYIDNGGIGIEEKLQPGIDEMITELKEKGFKEGEDFVYFIYPEDEHFESAWSKRFPDAIKFLLEYK